MNLDISTASIVFCGYRPAAWLRVRGADAEIFLQGQFTNDLRSLKKSGSVYGLWLDQKGKVLADSFIFAGSQPDEFWLMSYRSATISLRERLEAFVIADDVVIEDRTEEYAGLALLGAGARPRLEQIFPGASVFPGRRIRSENVEWIFPVDQLATARERVIAMGAAEISSADLERLRIEAGIPSIPNDIGPGELPNEGGLEVDAVSYTKGCYLGQEVMARLKSMGRVRRRLLRVTGSGGMPASLPAPLFLGSRKIGELRSAAMKSADEFTGLALLSLLNLEPQATLGFSAGGSATVWLLDSP